MGEVESKHKKKKGAEEKSSILQRGTFIFNVLVLLFSVFCFTSLFCHVISMPAPHGLRMSDLEETRMKGNMKKLHTE